MTCYIYEIRNKFSRRRYVGSAVDAKHRWQCHRSKLRGNRHHCSRLQASWNKHGELAFSFKVLHTLPTNDRKSRAELELKEIRRSPCFNSMTSSLDFQNFQNSKETNLKIGKASKEMHRKRPELAEQQSRMMKERFMDPTYVENFREGNKKHWTPERRKEAAERARKRWRNKKERSKLLNRKWTKEGRDFQKAKMSAFWASDKGKKLKAQMKKNRNKYWTDVRSGRIKRKKPTNHWTTTPEGKKKISATMRANWKSGKFSRKKNGWDKPGSREKLSKALKKAWRRGRKSQRPPR